MTHLSVSVTMATTTISQTAIMIFFILKKPLDPASLVVKLLQKIPTGLVWLLDYYF